MLLKMNQVTKAYRLGGVNVEVLNGVDFSVESGEFVTIMGTSGSGKTTLLHIVGTLLKPDKGEYHLDDRDVVKMTDNERADIRSYWIGYVFQTFDLIPEYSVWQNVALPYLYRRAISKAEVHRQVDRAIEIVGLDNRKMHRPVELSGGEMQRTAIARAIAVQPKLILADEPTGNLDKKNSDEVMELFQKLNQLGSTIVLVTHDREVAAQTHRVLHMQSGGRLE